MVWAGHCIVRAAGVTAGARSYLRYTDPSVFGGSCRDCPKPELCTVARTNAGTWPSGLPADPRKALHKRIERYQLGTRPVPHGYQSGTELGLFARPPSLP